MNQILFFLIRRLTNDELIFFSYSFLVYNNNIYCIWICSFYFAIFDNRARFSLALAYTYNDNMVDEKNETNSVIHPMTVTLTACLPAFACIVCTSGKHCAFVFSFQILLLFYFFKQNLLLLKEMN